MLRLTVIAKLDAWQRRHAAAALPVAVAKKFSDDSASSLAALIAYYAFFSLFPLPLVLVSVLGFVLHGDPSLRDDVVHTALSQIPVVGGQLRDQVHPLAGSGVALAVGLAGTLWAGLAVSLAVTSAAPSRRSRTCRASSSRAGSRRGCAASPSSRSSPPRSRLQRRRGPGRRRGHRPGRRAGRCRRDLLRD
jgi:Virulence factor BrkB